MTDMWYTEDAQTNTNGAFCFLAPAGQQSHITRYGQSAPYVSDVSRPAVRLSNDRQIHRGRFDMAKWNIGRKNGLWKGGRTITQHGYVLIRVGKDHRLADVRGYAYEHRLVAEKKIGRQLRDGEQVHHINGITTDNRPENLEVVESFVHHRIYHRGDNSHRRLPDEANSTINCKCGCGQSFQKYDKSRRPREYISGHNPMPSPAQDEIIEVLKNGPMTRKEIARCCNKSIHVIAVTLNILKHKKIAIQVKRGMWRLGND